MSNGYVQGTTHITYLKKKGNSRDRRKCIYYNGDGSCGNASVCTGSAHCTIYLTAEDLEKKKKREKMLAQKQNKKRK